MLRAQTDFSGNIVSVDGSIWFFCKTRCFLTQICQAHFAFVNKWTKFIFDFRGAGWYLSFYLTFKKILLANCEYPDHTQHYWASKQDLLCIPVSQNLNKGL